MRLTRKGGGTTANGMHGLRNWEVQLARMESIQGGGTQLAYPRRGK